LETKVTGDILPKIGAIGTFDGPMAYVFNSLSADFVSPSDADILIHARLLRNDVDVEQELARITRDNEHFQGKILVFYLADFEKRIRNHPKIVLARTSARRSTMGKQEILLPYLWECYARPFDIVDFPKAKVGFCGLVSSRRVKILSVFERATDINCSFVGRDRFWGGKPHDPARRKEFDDNIRDSQFVICQRGSGNFSMRFYQALSAGRIPVLVDTDMPLPFENLIPWRNSIVFEKNEKACLDRVREIFRDGRCREFQTNCRKIFDEYLTPQGFVRHVFREIERRRWIPRGQDSSPVPAG
jgi:hypothetical protein